MDIDYKKPVDQLVVDLINRDNPQLPFPIKYDECFFGLPTTVSVPAGEFRNTEVSVTPRPNSPYIGAFKVRYRRLRMQTLFPDGVWFDDWYIGQNLLITEVLPVINQRTGMQLKVADTTLVPTSYFYTGLTGAMSLAMHANNLAFTGTLSVKYAGKYPTSYHIPADVNMLVHWDGVPRDETDPLRRYTVYGHDFSAWGDYLETWSVSSAKNFATIDSDLISLVQYLADITGQPFNLSNNGDSWDLYGALALRKVLPTGAAVWPGVNEVDYNRVVSIYRSAKTGNMPDQLFLHYKV